MRGAVDVAGFQEPLVFYGLNKFTTCCTTWLDDTAVFLRHQHGDKIRISYRKTEQEKKM